MGGPPRLVNLYRAAPDPEYAERLLRLFGTVYVHAFNPRVVERDRLYNELQARLDKITELQAEYARHRRCYSLRSMVKITAGCVGLYRQWEGRMPNPKLIPDLIAAAIGIPDDEARRMWREVDGRREFHVEWVRFVTDGPGLKERALAVPT